MSNCQAEADEYERRQKELQEELGEMQKQLESVSTKASEAAQSSVQAISAYTYEYIYI